MTDRLDEEGPSAAEQAGDASVGLWQAPSAAFLAGTRYPPPRRIGRAMRAAIVALLALAAVSEVVLIASRTPIAEALVDTAGGITGITAATNSYEAALARQDFVAAAGMLCPADQQRTQVFTRRWAEDAAAGRSVARFAVTGGDVTNDRSGPATGHANVTLTLTDGSRTATTLPLNHTANTWHPCPTP